MYHIFYLLCFFLVYSFLGWCLEVAFCSINTGKFVNRGFLNGPVCPIYGFGATLIILLLQPLADNILLLFAASVFVTSLLELIGGFLLDKIFHTKWWDYSDESFNIAGYICLKFSLAWGICGVVLLKIIHPGISFILKILPFWIGAILLCLFYAIFLLDLLVTVSAILKMNKHLKEISEIADTLKSGSDVLAKNIGNTAIATANKVTSMELDQKRKNLISSIEEQAEKLISIKDEFPKQKIADAYNDAIDSLLKSNASIRRRLLRAFPNMKSMRHPKELERLRTFLFSSKQTESSSKKKTASKKTNHKKNKDKSK